MSLLARILFYPTLWWNLALSRVSKRRRWWDWVDERVLLGAFPLRKHVEPLRAAGIGAVINTCREHAGPLDEYRRAGIEELRLPIVDFTSPTLEEVRTALAFMEKQMAQGRKVYLHCKAGRGRSATIALCYLMTKGMSAEDAQRRLLQQRPHVQTGLARRPVVQQFAAALERSR